MKFFYFALFVLCVSQNFSLAQTTIDQNGLRTTVIRNLSTPDEGAMRYEIASISYNSQHWQWGGSIMVELFQNSFSPAYVKCLIHVGYGNGANYGTPQVLTVEKFGGNDLAQVVLGNPQDLTHSYGGYQNRSIPIYLDVKYYATYTVRISYLQQPVEQLTSYNQIKLSMAPAAQRISNFQTNQFTDADLRSTKQLQVTGDGTHYIADGNVGIGTRSPKERLSVNGKIRAHEVKVEMTGWPDYVFKEDYDLMSLEETHQYIKQNGHLPEIPKAEDVEQDGVSLGEMNKLLLKKIEELTLHLIELKAQVVENAAKKSLE